MKVDVWGVDGKKVRSASLPAQFSCEVRPDVIRKAFLVFESNQRQPYGAFPEAGKRPSVEVSRRRRNYRGSYGHGISRVPRKVLWKRGTQFGWVGAFAPSMVSGRRAHPPKASRDFSRKLNKKELRAAVCSAISATVSLDAVKAHGHRVDHLVPLVDAKIESLSKTKDVVDALKKLQLVNELRRVGTRKIRAGRGKMRGRKYTHRVGPLLVVSKECALEKAARNILGVDVCKVHNLNIGLLAPGGVPGRLTLFTEGAVQVMEEQRLFMQEKKKRGKFEARHQKKNDHGVQEEKQKVEEQKPRVPRKPVQPKKKVVSA